MPETVIIPHGNEFKKLRTLQTEICIAEHAIPFFPLVIRFDKTIPENVKFSSCIIEEIESENGEIFLNAKTEIENDNGQSEIHGGKMKIATKRNENSDNEADDSENIQPAVKKFGSAFPIEFPVFKTAKIELDETTNDDGEFAAEWKIFEEKWQKKTLNHGKR